MRYKIKWITYTALIVFGIAINFHQYIIESWMQYQIRNENIVISFTTTPHRIALMQDTIKTILHQTAKINAIYLNIPYEFKRDHLAYNIPAWLLAEKKITIIRGADYGPATKLLGTLSNVKLAPNTIIITLDDDIKYPKNLVLQLAYKAYMHPDKAIAICGSNPEYDLNGNIARESKTGIVKDINPDASVAIAQGFAGIAYRRHFFNDTIFAIQNAPQVCINSDDLYISFYLAQHNIPRQILSNRYINFYQIDWDNGISLNSDALHKLHPSPLEKHTACLDYMHQMDPTVKF